MVPRWLQDRLKRAPGEVLGRLGGVLGRSWGLLGPLETVLAAHEAINGSFWVVLEFDSLIQFIDSIS